MNDYMSGRSGKRLLVASIILGLLVYLTGAYQTALAAPSAHAGQCPGATTIGNTPTDDGSIVLAAGLTVCIHAGNGNTGQFVTDGTSSLADYILASGLLNNGEQVPNVSNYVVYTSEETSSPAATPSYTPTSTPTATESPTPTLTPTADPTSTPTSTAPPATSAPTSTPIQPSASLPPTDTGSASDLADQYGKGLSLIAIATVAWIIAMLITLRPRRRS